MDEESVQQVDQFVLDTCKTFSGFYIKLTCVLKHMIPRALVICKTNRACDYTLIIQLEMHLVAGLLKDMHF
jgi:hypothetical protein